MQLKQHKANESRLVTKIRWIIESRNGHIENFRGLGEVTNKSLPHIMEDYRIVGAIINCFFVNSLVITTMKMK